MNHNFILPFSKNANLNPTIVTSAKDFHLYTSTGQKILDGQCGNICCNLGYSQNSIVNHIYNEMQKIPFCRYNNSLLTEIADRYSKKLKTYFTDNSYFFFGNSGSDAIETALRLSYIHRNSQKSKKDKIISFGNSYHGSTWLTSSISDTGGLGQHLPDWPKNIKIFGPFGNDGEKTVEELLQLNVEEISCLVIEPFTYLNGLHECSEKFWEFLGGWTKNNDIQVILDESASGFFKTGNAFYYNKLNIKFDFIVTTKSITAGYAPLSCVAVHNDIWEILKNEWIVHGWTNNSSIVGLAAAEESLKIFESTQSNLKLIDDFIDWLQKEKEIQSIRRIGNFYAFDLESEKWGKNIRVKFSDIALENNLLLTNFKYDKTIRGLVPLNANPLYFDELKEKINLVFEKLILVRKNKHL